MKRLAQNIKILRRAFGYTQEELGDELRVKKNTISYYEKTGTVQDYTLPHLSRVFHISEDRLKGTDITAAEADALAKQYSPKVKSVEPSAKVPLPVHEHQFKDDASRRFYNFYQKKFETKELTPIQVGKELELGEKSYSYEFWKLLAKGKVAVSLYQVQLARLHHRLNPLYILGYSAQAELSIQSHDEIYGSPFYEEKESRFQKEAPTERSMYIGKVIDDILTKHQVPRTEYYEKVLKKTPRTLQRIIKGEVEPSFALVAQIAEDYGESLDRFRTKPVPKGHLLALLEEKEKRIELLEQQLQQANAVISKFIPSVS